MANFTEGRRSVACTKCSTNYLYDAEAMMGDFEEDARPASAQKRTGLSRNPGARLLIGLPCTEYSTR
jgi:hypothetical protein